MKKHRSIFYLIFFIFQLGMLILSVLIDNKKNDFDFLFGLHGFIPSVKYVALIGLILIAVDYLWARIISGRHAKEIRQLKSEHNTIKAKLFDMQEASKEESIDKTDSEAAPEIEEPHQEIENSSETHEQP